MARIYISDIIDKYWGVSASSVRAQISALKSGEKLEVIINSPGGSIFEGLEIYHAIKAYQGESEATVAGVAASMASIIMLGAKKTNIAKGSLVMIHNPLTFVYGNANDMRETAEVLDTVRDELLEIYISKSGKDREEMIAMLDKESWLGGEDAVSMGLADAVIESYGSNTPQSMAAIATQDSVKQAMSTMLAKLSKEDFTNYNKGQDMNITHEMVMQKAPEVADMFRAEGKASIDLEKIKAEAVETAKAQIVSEAVDAEKNRVSGIIDALAGTGFESEAKALIADGKTIEDAKTLALEKMKSLGTKHLESLQNGQSNVPSAPSGSESQTDVDPYAYGASIAKKHSR